MSRTRKLLLLSYALSGCAALVYELVWTRLLTLSLGHTVAAVSTVLAAFLGGLGIGSLAAGAVVARSSPRHALRLFAALELFVAGLALVLPYLLEAIRPLLAAAYGDAGGPWFGIVRILASLALVGVPAAAMGATFPVSVRAISDRSGPRDSHVAALYTVNTVGGAIGAMAAGFLLIPALGLRQTTYTALALNAASAGVALWLASAEVEDVDARVAETGQRRPTKRQVSASDASRDWAAAGVAVAITGFVATANEVAWTRTLALVVGPTTYAFAAMLTVFIVGLAAGSAVATSFVRRLRRPAVGLAFVLVVVAVVPLWSIARVETSALAIGETVRGSGVEFERMVRLHALTAASMLLPLSVALGAGFPFALALVSRGGAERSLRNIGWLYALNTAGLVAGSLCAGFVLIPWVGLQRTIEAAALVAAAGAAITVSISNPSRMERLLVLTASIIGGLAVWSVRPWDLELISGGAYKYAQYMQTGDLRSMLRAGTLLYYRDGAAATVTVRRAAGVTSLAIDGKVDASTGGDMLTQKLLAHLPLLLHARPRHIAIIGLGSGVTVGSALTHPVERVDVIEISEEVVEASHQFETENRRALADPRTHGIVGDGRSHIALGRKPYDVIVSEPSNPWMAGIAALFTREFFESVHRRLAPDGIFCQWAHTYDMREADLRSIAATFASVFPEGTMWLVGESDLLFIGSPAGVVPRLAALTDAYARPGVADDLRTVAVSDPSSLLMAFAGGPSELRLFAKDAVVQVDDRMALEFSAPRGLFAREAGANAAALRALTDDAALPPAIRDVRTRRTAETRVADGAMLLKAEAYVPAYDAFSQAVMLQPSDESAIDGLLRAAAGAQRTDDAIQILSKAAGTDGRNVPAHVGLSRLHASRGDTEKAIAIVQPLMRDLPGDPRPYEQVVGILADSGDSHRLRDVAAYMHERWPDRPGSSYAAAVLALLEGRPADAERLATAALARRPHEARFYTISGTAAASLGQKDAARRAFDAALQRNARDPVVYVNLGLLELESGNTETAARRFAEALLLDPESSAAREGLRRARR